jgi:Domain of unknown function (DUF4386)
MNSSSALADRRAAATIGVLYIVGTAAGILSAVVSAPLLDGDDYLAQVAANPNQLALGSLLILTMAFSLAFIPIVFWPIGRRYSERLAMGYVVFRGAIETVAYLPGAFSWLLLIELGKQPDQATADLVQTAHTVFADTVFFFPFVIGALMFYSLLYRWRLIPRWLSGLGLVGLVLYVVPPLASMFGVDLGFEPELLLGVIFVQEMLMALWLIVKGFNLTDPGPSPSPA